MSRSLHILAAALLALVLAASPFGGSGAARADECLSGGEIQRFVASGRILPLATALAQGGIPRQATILDVQACRNAAGPYYKVKLIGVAGNARVVNLPARP